MKRIAVPLVLALALAACNRANQSQSGSGTLNNRSTSAAANEAGVTPMAQRVAVLAILNKRNGIVQNITLRPGQSARWKDVLVHLRACETTAPWEDEKLTGAFVQVDVLQPSKQWLRIFSGWIYKESPSLNAVEHPIYDVWPKTCQMTFPAGPGASAAPVTSSNRSSAVKSAGSAGPRPRTPPPEAPPATAAAPPSAVDNNAT